MAGQRPTVAFVSDAEEFGGAERYAVMLVEQLRDHFEFVAIVGEDAAAETRRRLGDAGAEVAAVAGLRRRPTLGALRGLRRALRAVSPALVHINATDQGDSLGPLAVSRRTESRTVMTLHLVIPGRRHWRERISRWACRRVDAAIGVSSSVAAYLSDAGAEAVVVANGVAVPHSTADAREALGIGAGSFVVGGIGRLHAQKGWDVLCDAAAHAAAELPEAVFVVVGTGPEADALHARPTCDRVRFLGYREDAAAVISAFDVLAVPSRYEGFGLAAAEAMLLGVPVVASRTGGLEEVVANSGVLVAPEDPVALASAIAELARDPQRRRELATAARERAVREFGVDRMARETRAVYERVMSA